MLKTKWRRIIDEKKPFADLALCVRCRLHAGGECFEPGVQLLYLLACQWVTGEKLECWPCHCCGLFLPVWVRLRY